MSIFAASKEVKDDERTAEKKTFIVALLVQALLMRKSGNWLKQ
jgi:hypothetical protein